MQIKVDKNTLEPDRWIITGGGTPAYFIYELISGKVSIYSNSSKVNEINVKNGDEPVFLEIIAAMRLNRLHTASVRTDSEIVVRKHSMDQIGGILHNEIPEDVNQNLMTMIEAIAIKNDIDGLEERLSSIAKVKINIPGNLREDIQSIIGEILKLYGNVVK